MSQANFQVKIGVDVELSKLRAMELEMKKQITALRVLGDGGSESLKKVERQLGMVQAALGKIGTGSKALSALGDSLKSIPGVSGAMNALNGSAGLVGGAFLAAGAATQQFFAALNQADQLQDTAEQLGITASSLQTLNAHFGDAGIKAPQVAASMQKLRSSLNDALAGSEPMRRSFEALGLNIEELKNLAPDELMERFAKAINSMAGSSAAAAATTDILGRNSGKLVNALRALGTEGVENLKKLYIEQGRVTSDESLKKLADAAQKWEVLKDKIANVRNKFAAGIVSLTSGPSFQDEFYSRVEAEKKKSAAAQKKADEEAMTRHDAEIKRQEEQWEDVRTNRARDAAEAKRIADEETKLQDALYDSRKKQLEKDILAGNAAYLRSIEEEKQKQIAAEKLAIAQADQALSSRLAELDQEIALVEYDQLLSAEQKEAKRIELLKEQNVEIAKRIGLLEQEEQKNPDPDRVEKIDSLKGDITKNNIAKKKGPPITASDGYFKGLEDTIKSFGTTGQIVANGVQTTFGGVFEGLKGGIQGLIEGTMTWGDALRNIGSNILSSVIGAISEMFAAWMTKQIASFVLGESLKAAGTTSTIAQETATLPVKTAGAVASGISSFGLALVGGLAAAALIASFAGAFADGGMISGPGSGRSDSVLARVSNGEFVVNAEQTARHRGLLESINSGTLGSGRLSSPAGGNSPQLNNAITIGMFDTSMGAEKWAKSTGGEAHIVDVIARNIHRITGRG
jgi:hypothetical protein